MRSSYAALRGWVVQRVSALVLLALGLPLLLRLVLVPMPGFDEWRAWVGHPGVRAWLALFFLALSVHAWVGTRDVVMDYVNPLGLRLTVLSVVATAIVATLLWLGFILVLL